MKRHPSIGEPLLPLLSGSWRTSPAPLELSASDLERITPTLLAGGAGPLAWRRVRETPLRAAPAGQTLRQAARWHALRAALREQELAAVLEWLGGRGIEPLLVKGWAAARLYPERGLRPYGDIDLCVPPEQLAAARAALAEPGAPRAAVEIHAGCPWLPEWSWHELLRGSYRVTVGTSGFATRLLADEDHLRLLCLHALAHGVWRPLWLCDIAAALEGSPRAFDWQRLLGGGRRRSDWVACALGLAHRLLGAEVTGTPVAERAARLPRWLMPAVLRQWEAGPGASAGQWGRLAAALLRGRPGDIWAAARARWRNPVQATVEAGAPFNELPRLPFQLIAAARRAPSLAREVAHRARTGRGRTAVEVSDSLDPVLTPTPTRSVGVGVRTAQTAPEDIQ